MISEKVASDYLEIIEQSCPPRPSDLGITIPGDTWWPGQRETIDRIVSAFWQHKYVLANIPTGGGKTIVATAVQRILQANALCLTSTIQLQKQYQETMPWATLATGKANYPCGRGDDDPLMRLFGKMSAKDCEDYGGCEKGKREERGCAYYDMIDKASMTPQVIMNYAYALRLLQSKYIGGVENPFRRKLLIADEGHSVEDAIVDATSISLWPKTCKAAGLPPWPKSDEVYAWVAWATDSVDAARKWQEDATEQVSEGAATRDSELEVEGYKWFRRATMLRETISQLHRLDPTGWAVSPGVQETKLRPLWAWSVAASRLWTHFDRVLVMSATLGEPKSLMTKLAIPSDQSIYIDVASTFPIVNRPVFYFPTVKVNRDTDSDEWYVVADAIKHIANMPRLREENAIVHTGSYKIVNALRPYLEDDSRFAFQTSGQTKEQMILELRDHMSGPLIVLSPSLTTGVDIRTLRWQAIVKVPFGDLGDPITRLRREYEREDDRLFGRRNYDEESLNRVVQAAGRVVRTPTDWGVTYILDANFWGLYKRTYSPGFFQEAVTWMKT